MLVGVLAPPGGGGVLPAQEEPVAILQVGPERRTGIDELAPDVTPHWYAEYRIGERIVEVMQVADPLPGPAAWPVVPCAERQLRSADGRVFYHAHRDGWALLVFMRGVQVADAGDPGVSGVSVCRFVHRFIEELLLFERLPAVRRAGEAPMFPAIVEL